MEHVVMQKIKLIQHFLSMTPTLHVCLVRVMQFPDVLENDWNKVRILAYN